MVLYGRLSPMASVLFQTDELQILLLAPMPAAFKSHCEMGWKRQFKCYFKGG